ncbi:YY1-associated factor 2 [Meleagris gallopavo]|uniref:YY1-associated factor 2 n=1 Tax=Meleagris gallopavo TaxID=9103 RepID=UPI0002034CAD|nr:YY1-associated factor 2 [Meleagris gallopavo]
MGDFFVTFADLGCPHPAKWHPALCPGPLRAEIAQVHSGRAPRRLRAVLELRALRAASHMDARSTNASWLCPGWTGRLTREVSKQNPTKRSARSAGLGLHALCGYTYVVYICAHRKPRPVSQLVAQQVPQQFVPPTQSKKEKKDKVEKEKSEKETTSKKNSHKKTRPRLKNVDRSSAQHLEVTVGDLTVIITDFKEKTKSPPASSAASADQHSQSGSSSDNTERGMSRSSSPRGEASSLNGESH